MSLVILCAALALAQTGAKPAKTSEKPLATGAKPAASATPGAQQTAGAGAGFKGLVASISAGPDTSARGVVIARRLADLGVKYSFEKFTSGELSGANIVAELPAAPGASKRLLLGAHYDRVADGRGALDNASGTAAVLELLAAFKARPLKTHSVAAVFFDREEDGLLGSAAYAAADGGKNVPDILVVFDVFGYGDALWVMARKADTPAARAFRQAAEEAKLTLELGPDYPAGDHQSFAQTKAEAISLSLVGGDDLDAFLPLIRGERTTKLPRVLTIIHTDQDTPDKVDAAAAARALAAVEQAIRLFDSPPADAKPR